MHSCITFALLEFCMGTQGHSALVYGSRLKKDWKPEVQWGGNGVPTSCCGVGPFFTSNVTWKFRFIISICTCSVWSSINKCQVIYCAHLETSWKPFKLQRITTCEKHWTTHKCTLCKLHQPPSMGVGRGDKIFKMSAKKVTFLLSSGKNKFYFCPRRKTLG